MFVNDLFDAGIMDAELGQIYDRKSLFVQINRGS
jgi:hypothetical protein